MQAPRGVITVSELDRRLRRVVEGASTSDWVEGEVRGVRRAASGHAYFSLRDAREDAVIDCVMYRSGLLRAGRHLVEGASLQVLGRATVWAPRGRLQFIADALRPVGRGALLEALERMKSRLFAEGLFAPERKRPLPRDPRCIGVVTSSHGAAWHDIRVVAARRASVTLVLAPATVQGEGSAESLCRALDLIEAHPLVEAVIIGRGGGSLEDLMAFNDERVVRRVAACALPTVSAVGHEIDTTLCDLVADVRAATPSQAAEMLVPDGAVRQRELAVAGRRLQRAMRDRLREDRSLLDALRARVLDPRYVLAERQQALDELSFRLERRARQFLHDHEARVAHIEQRLALRHPRAVIQDLRGRVAPLALRLGHAFSRGQLGRRTQLARTEARLGALSPLSVLARGYAIVLDGHGRAVTDSSKLGPGDDVDLRLHRGRATARVLSTQTSAVGEEGQ
jgi:exodeoxyribonuclease VII large subunit